MKTAIFFDSFSQGGGAEKLVLELARTIGADVFTSGCDKKLYKEWIGEVKVHDIGNFSVGRFPRLGFIESALRFALFKPEQKYDLYIFSGFFSVFAAPRLKPNIWYCCQPNRTIYDLKDYQKKKAGFLGKALIEIYSSFWKPLDQWIVKKYIEKIVCISETVRKRVKHYYGRASGLIYPPIGANKHGFGKFGDFFFFAGRLIPEKRVELLLEAFSEMPEKNLVVAGSGPLEEKTREFAGKFPNIKFEGRASESEMQSLFADCLATVYLPVQEDFGMFPLEGNSAGKPCIAAAEGSCLETITEGKNGFLIKPGKSELKRTVENFTVEKAKKMKPYCIARARQFGKEIFEKKWKETLGGLD